MRVQILATISLRNSIAHVAPLRVASSRYSLSVLRVSVVNPEFSGLELGPCRVGVARGWNWDVLSQLLHNTQVT